MARTPLAGARIRRHRLDRGLKQTDLARICGISPSYLNLIEHDRRPIGGKLIADLAEALQVAPEQLSAGVGAHDLASLRSAAGSFRGTADVEIARTEEFALRFPGWAGLVVAQALRLDDLERKVDAMSDRMREDPALAASLHDILSTVTAIRSTAGILAGDDPVEEAWQVRFHRNLYEESQRLAAATEALVSDLEEGGEAADLGDPVDQVESWLGAGTPFAALEPTGDGVQSLKESAARDLPNAPAQQMALALIDEAVEDERRLPLADLRAAWEAGLHDPLTLSDHFQVRMPVLLRRMAVLPELGAGFVRCGGDGVIRLRRQVPGFSIPRYGAAHALWPLYAALEHPGRVEVHKAGPTSRQWERFNLLAIAETRNGAEVEGVMLILPEGDAAASTSL